MYFPIILKLTRLSLSLGGSWGSEAVALGGGGVGEGAFGLGFEGDGSLAVSLTGAGSALGLFSALFSSLGGDG